MRPLKVEELIFVDEMGANLSLARLYARALKGQRAYAAKPLNRGANVTTIGALGLQGMVAVMTVEGGTTKEVFVTYLKEVLVPQLRPGQVVVMDNLNEKGVKSALGFKLRFAYRLC